MYQRKDKSRIWKLTGAFFAAMVVFTLLSRAVYQYGTAVVTTQSSGSGTITHTVRTTGKAVQNQDLAVTTVGGLRVKSVWVNEGQQVRSGDVLFTLDLDYLAETITDQKREMEKQKLSIQDDWSRNYATAQQRSNQKAQAEENYTAAVSQAETTLERAERTLERAKKALEDYHNGVSQEETLRKALEQAKADHQTAQTALVQLQGEIEKRVQEAVEQAKQESVQAEPLPTQTEPSSAQTEPSYVETEPSSAQTEPSSAQTEPSSVQTEPSSAQTEPSSAQTEPSSAQTEPSSAQTEPPSVQTEPPAAQTPTVPTGETLLSGNTGVHLIFLSETTAPDLEAVEAAVRGEYAQRLANAQAEVERTRVAVADAQAELDNCQAGTGPTEQELLDSLERAQQGYDDALFSLENAKTSYGREIRSAELPDGSNHAAQIGQLNYDRMAADLSKLEALEAEAGEIRSPVDGVVTRCHVQTGEKTTDTTAVLLADLSRGCKFSGTIPEEQSKYIGVGDLVTLTASGSGKRYEDLTVTLLAPGEEGTYRLTVQLPENTLALGAGADLTFTRRSQIYNCCVPLSALHLDEKNQPYVLVAEEVKTVLGTEIQARKLPVTVLEQNDTTAALADGMLPREQQVIVSADRAIGPGSRVRVG